MILYYGLVFLADGLFGSQFLTQRSYVKKMGSSLFSTALLALLGGVLGGIDVLVFDDMFRALDEGKPMPIDVYDMATWMAISVLSEESMATGKTVYFPDFTDGKWIHKKNEFCL